MSFFIFPLLFSPAMTKSKMCFSPDVIHSLCSSLFLCLEFGKPLTVAGKEIWTTDTSDCTSQANQFLSIKNGQKKKRFKTNRETKCCVSFSHESWAQPSSQRRVSHFDPERCNKADKQQRVDVKLASFNYQLVLMNWTVPYQKEHAGRSLSSSAMKWACQRNSVGQLLYWRLNSVFCHGETTTTLLW